MSNNKSKGKGQTSYMKNMSEDEMYNLLKADNNSAGSQLLAYIENNGPTNSFSYSDNDALYYDLGLDLGKSDVYTYVHGDSNQKYDSDALAQMIGEIEASDQTNLFSAFEDQMKKLFPNEKTNKKKKSKKKKKKDKDTTKTNTAVETSTKTSKKKKKKNKKDNNTSGSYSVARASGLLYKNIAIDSNSLSTLNSSERSGQNQIYQLIDTSTDSFSSVKNIENFGNVYKNTEQGFNEVSKSLNNYVQYLNDYYDTIDAEEKKLSSIVQTIQTPKSVALNDFIVNAAQNAVNLSKNDGTSVKNGTYESIVKNFDEYDVRDQILQSMKTEKIDGDLEYEDASSIKSQLLQSMLKEKETGKSEYDDSSSVKKEILQEMTNKNSNETFEYDDSTSLREKLLQSMLKEKAEGVSEYNDSSSIKSQLLDKMLNEKSSQTVNSNNLYFENVEDEMENIL